MKKATTRKRISAKKLALLTPPPAPADETPLHQTYALDTREKKICALRFGALTEQQWFKLDESEATLAAIATATEQGRLGEFLSAISCHFTH